MKNINISKCLCASALFVGLFSGCVLDQPEDKTRIGVPENTPDVSHHNSVVWAVNVGGAEYLGVDGIEYQADTLQIAGETGQIDKVLGSQDSIIYKTYRSGDLGIRQPIDNGVYDITFKFAGPEDIEVSDRVFSVFAEGQQVIADLDVRLARDGNHLSALVRSATDIEVSDGQLDITFVASAGEPIDDSIFPVKMEVDYVRVFALAND